MSEGKCERGEGVTGKDKNGRRRKGGERRESRRTVGRDRESKKRLWKEARKEGSGTKAQEANDQGRRVTGHTLTLTYPD